MPRTLSEMLAPIDSVLAADSERAAAAKNSSARAQQLVNHMPLVHRTGKKKDNDKERREEENKEWTSIFTEYRILARPVKTEGERRLGFERAVYFFFGCAPYPEPPVAILLPAEPFLGPSATFTPFDSGALGREPPFVAPVAQNAPWTLDDRVRFLDQHMGSGTDLRSFAARYVAAHFAEPLDYVRRTQREQPDFPVYHGLRDDRRAWTLEVQLHDDVDLGAVPPLQVIVREQSMFDALRKLYAGPMDVASFGAQGEDVVGAAVAKEVVKMMEGTL